MQLFKYSAVQKHNASTNAYLYGYFGRNEYSLKLNYNVYTNTYK